MRNIVLAAMLAVAGPACAQVMTVGGTAAAVPMLRSGTEIALRTTSELTTDGKKLKAGDRFNLEVAEAVKVNGQVVIPAGARAVGEIGQVRNKGMWGKSGNIDAHLLYVMANDRQIRLAGTLGDKGKAGGVGAVAVSAIVFAPAGFFMTGTSARIPIGTQVNGRIDEDVQIAFAGPSGPAPMVIGAPAASAPAVVSAAAPASPVVTPVALHR